MRNLKKILALVLAMVMTLSVMSVAGAFSDDDKFDGSYSEAAEVLAGLRVFQGYPDDSFRPEQTITRAETAALIYRIATGDTGDANVALYKYQGKFTDVAADHWAAGYINYCANAEYIRGTTPTTFDPEAKVTGYQVLAMILRAVGYDANKEFTGNDWEIQVARVANDLQITGTVAGVSLRDAAPRQIVAELLFRTLVYAPVVKYTAALGYQPVVTTPVVNVTAGTTTLQVGGQTLGQKVFELKQGADTRDTWGRPYYTWTYKYGTAATIEYIPVATYWTAVKECDVASDIGFDGNTENIFTTYTNGVKNVGTVGINPIDTIGTIGAQGRLTEIYMTYNNGLDIVYIDTLLANVVSVANATYDAAGHLKSAATITLAVYDTNTTTTSNDTHSPIVNGTTYTMVTLTNGATNYTYVAGDMLLVNAVQYTTGRVCVNADQYVKILGKADSLVGAQTVIWYNASQHTVNGTVYNDNNRFHLDQAGTETTNHTWYFDTKGNLIGVTNIANQYTYGVVSNMYWVNEAGAGSAYAEVTYMDGTTTTAKIASIDRWVEAVGKTAAHYAEDCQPVYALSGQALAVAESDKGNTVGISTWANDNKDMFGDDLYRITTQANGTLTLDAVDEMIQANIQTGRSLVKGTASKLSKATSIYTNSNTQYLVKLGSKYTPITGFNSIYNYTQKKNAVVDYVVGADGYVAYAYVKGTPDYSQASKLVYVTNNNYSSYVGGNAITHYVINAVNIDGTATTVDTTDYTNVVLPLITSVGKVFYVTYNDDVAVNAAEVTETSVNGGKDVSGAYGDNMVAMVMDGAYRIGDVLASNNGKVKVNVTNSTTYAGDMANIGTHLVYVLVNKASTYVTGVYVSELPATAATASNATLVLLDSEKAVTIISNDELSVAGGETITNVALLNTKDWVHQGDAAYTVTATDTQSQTWAVTNVRVVGKVMTFDLTAPASVTTGTEVTLTWTAAAAD